MTGQNVLSSSLSSHLQQQEWSDLARSMLASRLEDTHASRAQCEPVFDRAVVLNAKSLIFLMTVPFTLLLPLVFMRHRRPFMTHVVFSLHLYTFLLLVLSVALAAAKASATLGFGGIEAPTVDNVLSVASLAAGAAYIHQAIGPVYGAHGATRVAQGTVLAVALAVIVLVIGSSFS